MRELVRFSKFAFTLTALLACFLASCTSVAPAMPRDASAVPPGPDASSDTKAETKAEPMPAMRIEPDVEPQQAIVNRVAIVLSNRNPAYDSVAMELGNLLQHHALYDLSDSNESPQTVFASVIEADPEVIVAIGLQAAKAAKAFSEAPVVFCQVFNYADNDLISERVAGVAAIPPLDLQLAAWKQLNPDIRSIGAILGAGHEALIREALIATEVNDVVLHHRIANSDRETLFLFNQLLPNIDGFWLFPDNRILSPSVLKRMLDYAARYGVEVTVFNDSLLDLGATISATSVSSDIAARILSVLDQLLSDEGRMYSGIVPLQEIDIKMRDAELNGLQDSALGSRADVDS